MLLAKIGGIGIMIWFYLTAKENQLPPIKWAISGLIGYWVVWWIVYLTIKSPLFEFLHTNVIANQIPAVCAIIAGVAIRKKFLLGAIKDKQLNE